MAIRNDAAEKRETPLSGLGAAAGDYVAGRTRCYADYSPASRDSGCRQAVILVAGLDARAFRLPCSAGMRVFEPGLFAVFEFEEALIGDCGAEPATDRTAIPVDLRDDWPSVLFAAGFTADVPTVWPAEGLLE